jgi:hypothetical protein
LRDTRISSLISRKQHGIWTGKSNNLRRDHDPIPAPRIAEIPRKARSQGKAQGSLRGLVCEEQGKAEAETVSGGEGMKLTFRTNYISMSGEVFRLLPRHLFRQINEQLQARYVEERRKWRSQLTVHDYNKEAAE